MKKTAYNKKDIVKTMTYVEALEKGLIDYNDIDEFISAWHHSDSMLDIDEFLGMTEEQYFNWSDNGDKVLKTMFHKGNKK